jgi:undecaprenyl-diphosphatase
MNLFQILLLAVLQGIAEFLPISSKGHLVLLEAVLAKFNGIAIPDPLELNILLHAGTLASILVFYRQQIWKLLTDDRRVLGLLAVGTVPVVLIGLPVHEIEPLRNWMDKPLLVGCMLPITGLLLIAGSRGQSGDTDYRQMSYRQALLIGLFQAAAILPGISRSGTTIVGGLKAGLRRDSAATFSFLLAIPAICGAVVLEIRKALISGTSHDLGPLVLGAAVSFVVGLFALSWLNRWLARGRLQWFAYWCIPLGVIVVLWVIFAGQ